MRKHPKRPHIGKAENVYMDESRAAFNLFCWLADLELLTDLPQALECLRQFMLRSGGPTISVEQRAVVLDGLMQYLAKAKPELHGRLKPLMNK
jgi:hypothetical protein